MREFKLTLNEANTVMRSLPNEVRDPKSGLLYRDGVLVVPDPYIDLVEAIDWSDGDAAALGALKQSAAKAIIERADEFTAPILSRYPEAERAGWDKREAEARAIIAAGDKAAAIAATSVIKALAEASGETTAETIARAEAIAAKADEFAAISAAVEIMRDTALTAIEAVEDAADMPATLEALKAQATALAAQYGLA